MLFVVFLVFFFFKQKTAYEMRISDWSSDVCSSDLSRHRHLERARDRSRGEREDVDVVLERFQPLLVRDAEALLLVDHNEPQSLELDRLGEHGVGADDDIDRVDRKSTRLNSSH